MRTVCAWCKKEIDRIGDDDDKLVSHGICAYCSDLFFTKGQKTISELLNRFEMPIMVINEGGVVRTANDSALSMLGKQREEVEEVLCGDVIECINASLPGGCGKTENCKQCAIRNSVNQAYETKKNVRNVIADQTVNYSGTTRKVRFRISAEYVEPMVFLHIHEMKPQEDEV